MNGDFQKHLSMESHTCCSEKLYLPTWNIKHYHIPTFAPTIKLPTFQTGSLKNLPKIVKTSLYLWRKVVCKNTWNFFVLVGPTFHSQKFQGVEYSGSPLENLRYLSQQNWKYMDDETAEQIILSMKIFLTLPIEDISVFPLWLPASTCSPEVQWIQMIHYTHFQDNKPKKISFCLISLVSYQIQLDFHLWTGKVF